MTAGTPTTPPDLFVEAPDAMKTSTTRLILPEWDAPPLKHLHSSLDLISLLHLDPLYDTYVKPFADPISEDVTISGDGGAVGGEINSDDEGGKMKGTAKKKKRAKLEKGYSHLLEDVIDPTPLGEKQHHPQLIPLVPEFLRPPAPPAHLIEESIQLLPPEYFRVARLDSGLKQEGYSNKEKAGVREAEEKRKL
ncbi:hypothetical protein TREMEDRAFT_59018 [Tremella mesenterica DSM 1558]|uniref:uncharacterized protein n=1 Tax=Tremella mesenterica (strain ATCC 24925 / CBS 8224 / DSM 1558 / NBRC 9311 / NRRL Y-6157 / RJB 2259-6 / UBC 559-6) TaxID=578456 RepID=UPI0003F4A2DA|nr:uncharacterized protein TREMEDRAFT_59018 [Tremella mesenterica DSM 1558]EIW72852.1 hypothetical protein TREMEDRAFT_59018 [Tremella mesenterica DSM 1558]